MWIFIGILTYILFWLTCIIGYAVHYLTTSVQVESFSQVLYTLQSNLGGAEGTINEVITGFFARYGIWLLLGTVIFAAYIWLCVQKRKADRSHRYLFGQPKAGITFTCASVAVFLAVSTVLGVQTTNGYTVLGIGEYLNNVSQTSTLYEDYYVDPATAQITFPEQKRNLIYIVCESMESTFTSQDHGGAFESDLIPGLTDLAKSQGTDFSNDSETLNGAYVANNTGWTIAGLVAQSAGIPLSIGNGEFNRNFDGASQFLPYVTTMGDILEANGYHNYFMCGSDAAFAGRRNYYEQHGNYTIFDYNQAKADGEIPEDYYVWWGYEDSKLFEYAKKELTDIAVNDQPFNFTLLTVDTHFQDGYMDEGFPTTYENQYENVIAGSDAQIAAFIEWCQQQPFYENTTIVVTGDHLSMDALIPNVIPTDYQRKALTLVINGPEYNQDRKRDFTTLDLFPTILEALNVQIEGHRLGLGTSLYSDVDTLVEQMGFDEFNKQISYTSDFYTRVLLNGDESKQTPEEPAPANPEEDNPEALEAVPPSAQEYEEQRDLFDDPSYTYTPSDEATNYWTGSDTTTNTTYPDTSGGYTEGGNNTWTDGSYDQPYYPPVTETPPVVNPTPTPDPGTPNPGDGTGGNTGTDPNPTPDPGTPNPGDGSGGNTGTDPNPTPDPGTPNPGDGSGGNTGTDPGTGGGTPGDGSNTGTTPVQEPTPAP